MFRDLEKEDSLPTTESRLKQFKDPSPIFDRFWWLAYKKQQVMGYGLLSYHNRNSSDYEQNKHAAYSVIRIDPDHRRKGIGTEIAKLIVEKAKETKIVTIIQTTTAKESGNNFCKKLKGITIMESSEHRCKLVDVNWNLMSDWKLQGQKTAEENGLSLVYFQDVPEELIEKFCILYSDTSNQQPLGGFEGRTLLTPDQRRTREERNKKKNIEWHTMISREPNGEISGLSEVYFDNDRSHEIEQDQTGVKEQFRGNGLGKWLKAEMVYFIHKKYPKVKYIVTGNAESNVAMRSINDRMGFKLHMNRTSYKFKLEELEEILNKL
ncbi:MAG: GNAT family N-acetyltransferase [Candidatus Heimdallarchaeota archaeon]